MSSSEVPISHFRPSSHAGPSVVLMRSKVMLKETICVVDTVSGTCSFIARDEELSGYMFDKPFSSGSMKHAYDFHLLNGDQYVVKRFFKLTDDDEGDSDPATYIPSNKTQIECNVIWIFQGKWFLQAFYKYCKAKPQVPVDTALEFAKAFLGQEVGRPSRASGLETEDKDAGSGGLTWLIERKCPTSVIKFSGTLIHKMPRRDPHSLTILVFAHFVYSYSDSQMIFTDIQGSPAQVKGRDGVVLFDVMTHTVDGDSGVGDFGPEGIETFVQDHECGTICWALGLNLIYPLGQAQSTNHSEGLVNVGGDTTGKRLELVDKDGNESED